MSYRFQSTLPHIDLLINPKLELEPTMVNLSALPAPRCILHDHFEQTD